MKKIKKLTLLISKFFDCLFQKKYWQKKILPMVKKIFKKIISIYFWVSVIESVCFSLILIIGAVISLGPVILILITHFFFPNAILFDKKITPDKYIKEILNLN